MLEVWSLSKEQWGAIKILDKDLWSDLEQLFSEFFFLNSQTTNIICIMEKAREFQKNICFTDYTKTFDCVNHSKPLKIS